jgi:hypothetical protein
MFESSLEYETFRFGQIETVLDMRQRAALRDSNLFDVPQGRQEHAERLWSCQPDEVLNGGTHARRLAQSAGRLFWAPGGRSRGGMSTTGFEI